MDRVSLTMYSMTPKNKTKHVDNKADKHSTWKEMVRSISLIGTSNSAYENVNKISASQIELTYKYSITK